MAGCLRVFLAIGLFWSVLHFQDAIILKEDRQLAHVHPELFSEVTTGGTHDLHHEKESKESRLKREADVDSKHTQNQEELTTLREAVNRLQSNVTTLMTQMDERERAAVEQSCVIDILRNDIALLQSQGSTWVSRDDFEQLENKLETLVGLSFCKPYKFHYHLSCYHIVNEKLTWNAAKENCRKLGGKLAEIESFGENDYIKKFHAELKTENVWLGGTDQWNESNWVWASSNKVIKFENWDKGQPDNAQNVEHCLSLQKIYNYNWNDGKCQVQQMSVCEISVPTTCKRPSCNNESLWTD